MTCELYVVEYEDGEMLDASGDGGFSVFLSAAEAHDAMQSEIASHPENSLTVVRFLRDAG
jgi:hypothetical protein